MEASSVDGDTKSHPPPLSRPSTSFRLRSSSLNTVRLRRVFDLFDHNHDNFITVDEICEALNRLGLESSPNDLLPTISAHIKPGNSGLDFDDFMALHRSIGDSLFGDDVADKIMDDEAEEDLREAFGVFDVDGDGFICARELQTVLCKLGLADECGDDGFGRAEAMICSVDKNDDGRVDFEEFKNMMAGISSVQIS
ncbi:Calcium-binding protein CML42 [Zostera marina]|uniref:Calcium-binding protein CML42 n=1 Tax=Zostera marina TaxID=29655 RepID=A0A0K9NYA1_ZOSMR|nr:Calcium-binding protein CML42 [Zostera marina]